jgi:hypothetical protein
MRHEPEQHSSALEQASPSCEQNEEASLQTPPAQSFEQQSAPSVQALPAVLQLVLRGTQVPSHLPLQHWSPLVQAWLSCTQASAAQEPLSQRMLQHSSGELH